MNEFLTSYLGGIIPVAFRIQSGEESMIVGRDRPEFTVTLNEDLDKKELLTSTSLALGEAYMKEELEVDRDLYEVLNLFLGQMGKFKTDKSALKKLILTSKAKKNQEKEVRSHYDIGNEFYRLWLDETMSYSCGYFKNAEDTLYDAQVNKADHILEKLQLQEGMTLLDIGCGWGFLLMRAAKKYGIKGTGITLSKEQYQKFSEDIEREGLKDCLQVELMDYRDLKHSGAQFDRVVSVGMLEHVGRGNYELFMENAEAVLKPEGLWAIILPGAASTLPVFIMTRFFLSIPSAVTEAAAVDGASPIQTFLRLGLPLGAPGILSVVVLGFLEYWNAMEAPQAFLKDQTLWPLSLYMANITADNAGVSLIASLITLMPPLLIFLFGQRYLEQGIISSGMKD
ncbi:class I SAM-dependent methyltransferase [[Clostridium] scindens]|uniref:class I SAM-dependent methyltransferase n=1 Tax=Clostridium scindens (strain JCM 10418 / VPI 12708) TaxID=29347 RepID=UPI001D08F139|nr:class I SAM-dependent methyltransferase [[Clostridium] scindens]MCB6644593.1 class I SAM-dependent methyltransferase [[Clostridium] scindens]